MGLEYSTGPPKLPSRILMGFSVRRGPTSTSPRLSAVTLFFSGLGTTCRNQTDSVEGR